MSFPLPSFVSMMFVFWVLALVVIIIAYRENN